MKRKVLSVLLCAAMTLGVVAGCGSSSDTGSTDSASKTETKGEKTDSSSDKVTTVCLTGIVKTRYRQC